LSGDFCSNLDESVETVITDGSDSTLIAPLVEHYTGDCSERLANLAIKAIGAAQDVAKGTMGAAMGIMTAVGECVQKILRPRVCSCFVLQGRLWEPR